MFPALIFLAGLKKNMKSEPDLDYIYPLGDCSNCGKLNVPFGTLYYQDEFGMPETMLYCLNCHTKVEEIVPKGYLSILELEEMGWNIEL